MKLLELNSIQKDLSAKKYSLTELVDRYLARIKSFDKEINSFITVTQDYAYSRAKSLQKVLKNNPNVFEEFPLFGAVFSVKDVYLTKGIRTTAGSRVLSDFIPPYSATVIERIEKAGAILIGKTNCDAWAHGGSGENSDFGNTRNPWDKRYVPGGSSSGSAACVAAGFAFASLGTDTGGSIRQPAGFTNLVGLKPTYGAVSRYGVIAMASSLDCMGHFTHTVDDSEAIFSVTKGLDGKDSTLMEPSNSGLKKKIKVLGVPEEYTKGADSQVNKRLNEVRKTLESAGYKFVSINLPHMQYAVPVYYIIQPAEVASNLSRYDGVRFGRNRANFGKEAKRRIMIGTHVLSSGFYDAYYLKAMKVRTKIMQDFQQAFEKVDAIFAPVSPTPPFKIGEKTDDPLQMYLSDIFTVSANLAGLPALTIPAGFSDSNLPIGFQLIGKSFSEYQLFDIGKDYQSRVSWHLKTAKL